MSSYVPFFVLLEALGALIGASMALAAEIIYLRTARTRRIDEAEHAHMRALGRGLSFGMTLLLLASLALVVGAFVLHDALAPALSASYWLLIVLSLLVIYVSWALSRRRISFALGSAIAFTGWWFLAYLALGLFPGLSFGASVALYVVATGIFYGILRYVRFLVVPPLPSLS